MNIRRILLGLAACSIVDFYAAQLASAGVIVFSDQSSFESHGTIVQTSNFDDLATGTSIAVPFPRGGVTYTNVDYTIDGPGAYGGVLDSVRQTLFNARLADVAGNIDVSPTTFSMFGFKTGYVTVGPVPVENVTLTTNMAVYPVSGLIVPQAGTSLGFVSFATTMPGEYFTGFDISTSPSTPTAPTAPVMTDVELGNVAAVPEPAGLALAAIGLLIFIGEQRRRRR